ncbi:MAG TPA: isoaspartyl peptidase/L-asparaginase [Terriglobales bacterium]|nr:isoaspartyl peptidase/L-asparaginase [Terriglobales bacterium]
MATISRRNFAAALAAGLGSAPAWLRALPAVGAASKLPTELQGAAPAPVPKLPVVVASANGYHFGATAAAYAELQAGADTLEAVLAGVNKNEENPLDMSVGYGALPDEDGVVTNDACCIHGPSMEMGVVGNLAGFLHSSRVAQAVMNNTDQIFLVGEGAARFGAMVGCRKAPPGLTTAARQRWLLWKESRSLRDAWGPGLDSPRFEQWQAYKRGGDAPLRALEQLARQIGIPEDQLAEATEQVLHPPHGTINCLAVNRRREISGVTTTAGRAFKIRGRVGDSPIIGAGCYVDGEVGGAGSTGRGEEDIRVCGGHTIVEQMRLGKTPQEACLEACRRIAHLFRAYPARLPLVDIQFYALRVDGLYGAASLWGRKQGGGGPFAVHDGVNRTEPMAYLLERAG